MEYASRGRQKDARPQRRESGYVIGTMAMAGKRQFGLVGLTTALAGLCAIALFVLAFRGRYEDGAMVVTWKQGTGRAFVVDGVVTRAGEPVEGVAVAVEDSSGGGGQSVTGPKGSFSVSVGEPELLVLHVDRAGRVEWELANAPSTRDGLEFVIELKP